MSSHTAISMLIVTGGTAYQCQRTGEVFILMINEAIWLGSKLNHSLWNPNQMRHFGVGVEDNPLSGRRLAITHLLLEIPFYNEGTTIFIETRVPTQDELETCLHVHLSFLLCCAWRRKIRTGALMCPRSHVFLFGWAAS